MKPNTVMVKETILPEVQSGQVLVSSSYSAISPGTERLVFNGQVPENMAAKMRVPYMEGSFSFPVKYGYSLVGEVIQGNEELLGKRVHVMHPHQDYAVVHSEDLQIIPDTIENQRAALLSNLETCVNAIWDSRITIGDRVLVVGFGAIGSLLSIILKQMSLIKLEVVDIKEEKLKIAESIGMVSQSTDQIDHDRYDVVFHTSSSAEGLQTAIDAAGKEGKVIEMSWYGTSRVNLNLGSSFHLLRKKIISSQVSTIPSFQQPRWDRQRRKEFVLEILQSSDFDRIITSVTPFYDIVDRYSTLCNGENGHLSSLIQFK